MYLAESSGTRANWNKRYLNRMPLQRTRRRTGGTFRGLRGAALAPNRLSGVPDTRLA